MDRGILFYSGVMLIGVFISAVSQVMLKMAAIREYSSKLQEYLNPLVLSWGPGIESMGYIFVTVFDMCFFHERVSPHRWRALFLIILGILVFSLLG